jgi:hypothetical protein
MTKQKSPPSAMRRRAFVLLGAADSPPPSDIRYVMVGRDLDVNAKRRLQHPDRNRPCEDNLYTSIPIKPWPTAIEIACSLFFAPSFRSAQKSNASISLSPTLRRVAISPEW